MRASGFPDALGAIVVPDSKTHELIPLFARAYAVELPANPAPIIITSYRVVCWDRFIAMITLP